MSQVPIAKLIAPAVLAASSTLAAASERSSVIALSGQAAPVSETGVTFKTVDYPAINNAGQVVFQGRLQGGSVSPLNDLGYFMGSAPSALAVAARNGDSVENHHGSLWLNTYWPSSFNDAGQLAFSGRVNTALTVIINAAFVTKPGGGAVHALAVQFQPYPDGSGDQWGGSLGVALNHRGTAAVLDRYSSLWSGSSAASLQLVARSGEPTNGPPDDTIYDLMPGRFRINDSGFAVLGARLATGGGTGIASAVLFGQGRSGPGNALEIVRSGRTAFGAPDGTTFGGVTLEGFSRANRTLVHAALQGPNISTANDTGLWQFPNPLSLSPEGPAKVVQEGDPAPGFGPGVTFGPIATPGTIFTGDGRAVFKVGLRGVSNFGVWEARAGSSPKRLLSVGDTVAGAPPGTTISSISYIAANAVGQATVGGTGAIFGYDPSLGAVLLVNQGDEVEVAPGDIRTIKHFGLSAGGLGRMIGGTGHDGLITPLNDAGVLSYQATFTDDSQAILTVRVPVAGDATNDGIVDAQDFHILYENFAKSGGDRALGDFNLDGKVNFGDFQMLERNFGRAPPGMSAGVSAADYAEMLAFGRSVPEPGGMGIVALAVVGGLTRRRRRP